MKKFFSLLLAVFMLFSLASCSSSEEMLPASVTETVSAMLREETDATGETETTAASSKTANTDTAAETASSAVSASVQTGTTGQKTGQKATEKTTGQTKASAQTTKQTTQTAKKTTARTAQTTAAATTAASSEITCYVTIDCRTVLSHMDNLKAGHEAFVPEDGMILQKTAVTVEQGDTAYDALMTAAGENGISVSQQSTSYGKYISGINQIDEKDCGPSSGWLYMANNSMPGYACSSYTVSSGDSIVFKYTCG